MATTVIFAEIMIMGIITLTWLLILSLRLGLLPMNDLVNYLPMLKEWSTPVLILAAAVAYQLGSIMNTFSFGVMDYLWGNKIRNSIMSPYDCETASATVHQVGSSEIVKGVQAHITYSRLARSGLFNLWGSDSPKLASLAWSRYCRLYERIYPSEPQCLRPDVSSGLSGKISPSRVRRQC